MKKIVTIVAIMILSTAISAKDNVFIGANYAYSTSQQTMDNGQKSKSGNTDTYFVMGKYFNEYRAYMTVGSSNSIGLNGDYMFELKNTKFTPYVGVGLHYYKSKTTYSDFSGTSTAYNYYNSDESVWTYGAEAGFTYPINKHFEYEAGFGIGRTSGVNYGGEVNYQQINTGINYLF